ncbi:NAD(P)H-dependent glycerol-3-phosphate dehydrogenase [Planktothrix sp. FACHB-1365]|uniref:NAD(P)H-dependent glycerol-3-phosphate dehydrogenase n=1 Tax=Planktothrix sp. FACHB-1365 TaxID=2692855 RepID=UPI0016845E42|nr:NAD(P)H-dependent glycerol-3-phosphate dehydrogenase [Planktothrix sp. FACHB-1365]MBD2480883.1 NAD(P)H-dependent glycerol-3-phosphate dehydrogenase [Planktothrix sp. FACHB-1365]
MTQDSTSLSHPPVPHQPLKLAILGAGAWGSALAQLARYNGHTVNLWSRRFGNSLEESINAVDVLVSAISMRGVAVTAQQLQTLKLPKKIPIVTATKGLDPDSTRTPSQLWETLFPQHPIVVLSGPNLSAEIEQGLPAATVVASENLEAAKIVQMVFASNRFRVYTSSDPMGTELGGTLKNVIAIAAGVCDGLKLGTNAKSALLTRALTEIIRIGTHLGGKTETFFGLSGLGDMLTTCNSALSRNYRVGYGLAEGKSLEQVLTELGSTAEGVNTTNVLIEIAHRERIPVPISWQVYQLLNHQITPQKAVEALMERDLKPEFYDR